MHRTKPATEAAAIEAGARMRSIVALDREVRRLVRQTIVIRIAVSPRAYRAIKAALPAGSVVYPPERDGSPVSFNSVKTTTLCFMK